jgi:hypothetical protein
MKCFILFLISFLVLPEYCDLLGQTNNEFRYLIGEWVGSGGGSGSGQGEGSSVFRYDLDSNVIIRENYAHYPAQNNKPEYTHKDLMVIYWQAATPRAIYIDNEKHVINYNIELKENKLVLTSEEIKGTPQFRMTYDKLDNGRINLTFEIAPPITPGKFMPYISAEMKKK